MTNTDLILIGIAVAVVAVSAILGYIEVKVIKAHNEKLIGEVHCHVSTTASALNTVIKDVKSSVTDAVKKPAPAAAAPVTPSSPEEKKP